jgi:hypothetical protein
MEQSVPKCAEDCNTKSSAKQKDINPCKHWFFTYNNYNNDDISVLCATFNKECEKYVFQQEIGELGTPHLQGYCHFIKKIRPFSLQLTKKINWTKAGNKDACIQYCQKIDTCAGECYSKGLIIKKKLKTIKDLYDWQQKLITLINTEPDDRTINWIWCDAGNNGKSAFAKYCCINYNAIVISGKRDDMKNGIYQYIQNGGIPKVIIIDVPRCNENFVSYSGIEEIKNGCFFSPKYEGGMCLYDSPHIIVFANTPPKLELMSSDRWNIIQL